MHGTIVCGITASPEARGAAQAAAALAARLDLRLVLVHVADGTARRDAVSGPALEEVARDLGGHVEARIVHGNRVDGLAQAAADEGADAIVLGARGRGSRVLRCGLARRLEAAQTVPVVVAPPATRARSGRRLALADTRTRR